MFTPCSLISPTIINICVTIHRKYGELMESREKFLGENKKWYFNDDITIRGSARVRKNVYVGHQNKL